MNLIVIVLQYFILNIIFCFAQHDNLKPCPNDKPPRDKSFHCSQMCSPFFEEGNAGNFGSNSLCVLFNIFVVPSRDNYLIFTMYNKCVKDVEMTIFAVQAVDGIGFPIGRWDIDGTRNLLDDVCKYKPDYEPIPGVKSSVFVHVNPTNPNIIIEKTCQLTAGLRDNAHTNKASAPTYIYYEPKHQKFEDFKGFNALWYYDGPPPQSGKFVGVIFRVEWKSTKDGDDLRKRPDGKEFVLGHSTFRYDYAPRLQPAPPLDQEICFYSPTALEYSKRNFHENIYLPYVPNIAYLKDIANGNTLPPASTTSTTTTTATSTTTVTSSTTAISTTATSSTTGTPTTFTTRRTTPAPITRRPTGTPRPIWTLPTQAPTKNTPPTPKPPDPAELKDEKEKIYSRCKVLKKCLPSTENPETDGTSGTNKDECIKRRDCIVMISYGDSVNKIIKEGYIYIELIGQSNYWVAMGLSNDKQMGDDFVIECVKEDNSEIKMYTSWNTLGQSGSKTNIRMNKNKYDYVILEKSGLIGNEMYCKFQVKQNLLYHDPKKNGTEISFNLKDTLYYIVTAIGISQHGISGELGNLNPHTESTRFYSRFPVAIGSRFSPNEDQQNLIRLHGAIMFIAFLFFIPNALFIARYFKETFIEISIWGLRQWLLWHIILQLVGLILILIGHFFLTFANEGWNSPGNEKTTSFHFCSSLGTATFYLFNIILGFLDRERPIGVGCDFCHWLHSIIGHVTYITSILTLIKADEVLYSYLPCMAWKIVLSWAVICIGFHILMSYHYLWIDWVQGIPGRAYTMGPLQALVQPQSETVAPGKWIRVWILIVFVLISGSYALCMTLIAVFSYPREDTNSTMSPCYTLEQFIDLN